MTALGLMTALALVVLGGAMRQVMGTFWHPASLFALVWGAVIGLIALATMLGYFPVGPGALALFSAGTLMFITGALVGDMLAVRQSIYSSAPSSADSFDFRLLAIACALLHALMLPLWWGSVASITNESSDLLVIAFQLRLRAVSDGTTVGPFVGNYLDAGLVIVPLLAVGVVTGRLTAWLALLVGAPWVATNLVTNGRAALLQLVLVLVYVRLNRRGALSWRPVLGILLLFATVFVGGVVLVGKSDVDIAGGMGSVFTAVIENFFDYALQGPILFSLYFENPHIINPSWDALSFPCTVLERLGMCKIGPLHQDFLDFGTHGREGNVYSVYLSIYPKYGLAGTLVLIAFYGAWSAYHHRRALVSSSLAHLILAAYLFSAIPLSIFSDLFAPNLYFLLRALILITILQMMFRRSSTWKRGKLWSASIAHHTTRRWLN